MNLTHSRIRKHERVIRKCYERLIIQDLTKFFRNLNNSLGFIPREALGVSHEKKKKEIYFNDYINNGFSYGTFLNVISDNK